MTEQQDSAPARPKLLTLDEVLKLDLTVAKLVDLAADGAIRVYARGARFENRTINGSTTAYPTGTTSLGAAEAAYVLANYPFDEIRVSSSWAELDVVMKPANIRFVADEVYSLADPQPSPIVADEICALASPQTPVDMGMTWPWGDYQTPLLEVLAATVQQFFVPRKNPDPKRDEVVAWIKDRMAKTGLDDSANLALAMFSIIKHVDHAPRKRRPRPKGLNP